MGSTASATSSVVVQRRDQTLLRDLAELGAMAVEHCAEFYFEGSSDAARIRIRALASAGLVRLGKGGRPARTLVFPAPPPESHVEKRWGGGSRAKPPRRDTLDHGMAVLDVKAAFHRASRAERAFSVMEFGTSPQLYGFPSARGAGYVLPDGFLRLRPNGGDPAADGSFFLEVDRSTETVGTLVEKARDYLAFHQSGGFARRNGSPGSRYRSHPFRLLVVLKSEERRNNLAAALSRLPRPILTLAWLATLHDVISDPAGAIWLTPAAYRQAVRGTRFAGIKGGRSYRTDPARESLVEERAVRRRLFP